MNVPQLVEDDSFNSLIYVLVQLLVGGEGIQKGRRSGCGIC